MDQLKERENKKERRQGTIFQQGKKKYLAEVGKQLDELERLISAFPQKPRFEEGDRIYRIVHTIKGSAAIFDFSHLGTAAEQMLHLFEWTQQVIPSDDERDVYLVPNDICEHLLKKMRMEHQIGLKEVELDDRTEQSEEVAYPRNQFRLLLIDDDDVLRSFLVRRLQLDGYQVDEAADVATAKKKLHETVYDLVTLDLMMQPESGYVLFDFLKEDPTLKWLPLIVLSGREDVKDKVKCYRLGADQYVTKPFHYKELEAGIYRLLLRNKHFEQMAFLDPLTGVFNRRYFDHQLKLETQRALRSSTPMALAFIDIDYFKRVNDTFGHHVGDLVLQGLAHMLQKHVRSTDLLARYGGEEFVVAFPDTTAEQAADVLNRILEMVREEAIVRNEGEQLYITFSAGVAEWNHRGQHEWIRLADEAMYQAKNLGRNRVCVSQETQRYDSLREAVQLNTARKRILLADDDYIIRSIIKTKLAHLDVEFVEATDGEQAYSILSTEPFDLCILDGVMPKLDGLAILQLIRNNSKWADVKVLMLSGRKQEADIIRGLDLGANDYMSKPFSIVELEMRVRRLLEQV